MEEMRMIRCGMALGFGFLMAVAFLEVVTRPGGPSPRAGSGLETDVSEQVWQVLAEARRILEESA